MTDLPAAAVQKGAEAWRERQRAAIENGPSDPLYGAVKTTTWFIDRAEEAAEAVLRAATRPIPCPARDWYWHSEASPSSCYLCGGSGTIRIVVGGPNEENAGNEHRAGAHDEVT